MAYDIAIVGATGAVGREMLQTLFERKFPISSVHALASKSSLGKEVSFGDSKTLKVAQVILHDDEYAVYPPAMIEKSSSTSGFSEGP